MTGEIGAPLRKTGSLSSLLVNRLVENNSPVIWPGLSTSNQPEDGLANMIGDEFTNTS